MFDAFRRPRETGSPVHRSSMAVQYKAVGHSGVVHVGFWDATRTARVIPQPLRFCALYGELFVGPTPCGTFVELRLRALKTLVGGGVGVTRANVEYRTAVARKIRVQHRPVCLHAFVDRRVRGAGGSPVE